MAKSASKKSKKGKGNSVKKSSKGNALRFTYDLEGQKPAVWKAGNSKEVSVRELPISKGIAGVSMRLRPGGIRELHWHAIAAEWGFFITGNARVTVLNPDGQWDTQEYGPGDIFFIPMGHAHYIESIGGDECHFILAFNNGAFNEFSTFSVTAWIAQTPKEVLSKNFGLPGKLFDKFPRKEVYMALGEIPGKKALGQRGRQNTARLGHKFPLRAQEGKVYPGGTVKMADVSNFPVSDNMAGALMTLKPGALREMHWHPNANEWGYLLGGKLRITLFAADEGSLTEELGPGEVFYIPQGCGHYLENVGDEEAEILLVFDNGAYQEISISEWIADTPPEVVSAVFGVSGKVIGELPREEVFISAGSR
ncbi:MAG: cupin domain-containing protein [Thermodesulfobacteriota bacterium]